MSSRADRRKFVQALAREGLSLEEITRRYDAKFGTHYSKRLLLSEQAPEGRGATIS